MAFDFRILPESGVYTIYELYKSIEKDLESKENLSEADQIKLANTKFEIQEIENYTVEKRAEGLRWSLVSIFKEKGSKPTLIMDFYPGSDAYKKFGKTLVANAEFSNEDIIHIFESMRDESPRVVRKLKILSIPGYEPDEVSTADIFKI